MTTRKTAERKPTPREASLANLRIGGGRPKGVPNKATREIRELAQRLFDAAYWERTQARLAAGELAPALECRLLAYAYGEPKTQPPPPQFHFDPTTLSKLSDEELEKAIEHADAVQRILEGADA